MTRKLVGGAIRNFHIAAWLAATVAALAIGACSSDDDSQLPGGGANGSGANGSGGDTTSSGVAGFSSSGNGGSGGGFEECAAESHLGDRIPLDLVVMLDKSGSMNSTVNNVTLWTMVTDALAAFAQSTDSNGIGIGLQYFPIMDGPCGACGSGCPSLTCVNNCCGTATGNGCSNPNEVCPSGGLCVGNQCYTSGGMGTCDIADYAALDVPIALLNGNAGAIVTSLGQHSAAGLTPTGPALAGAIQAAITHATTNPDHKVAVVLATDGVPTECSPQDIGQIADIAEAAANGTPEVLTFVIGIGDLTALNAIAADGGTGQAFIVNPSGNTTQDFIDAMNAIRGSLLECEFDVPTPDEGSIDFKLVNVQVTPDGEAATVIPQVPNEAACDSTGGWYYDDPVSPTKIILCPASCDWVKSLGTATLEIVLGCETVVK